MSNKSRYALLFGVALAITMVISACGSTSSGGGSTPTASSSTSTSSTLGTPGSYNCVQGSIT
ncbi:MAG TPA: hypothetical protein VED37_13440, partial [Ktedonobacteraceae bacterium]|nr:hypothetical protein [Ktedonobacteraceae bacterium]